VLRGVRSNVGRALSGGDQTLARCLRIHSLPRLSFRSSIDDLHHERHRKPERPFPPGYRGPGPFPQRSSGSQSGRVLAGPRRSSHALDRTQVGPYSGGRRDECCGNANMFRVMPRNGGSLTSWCQGQPQSSYDRRVPIRWFMKSVSLTPQDGVPAR
jgi:hypothetical protein